MTLKLSVLVAFLTVTFFLLQAFGVALPFTQEQFLGVLLLLLPLLGVDIVEDALRAPLHEAFPQLVAAPRPKPEEVEAALAEVAEVRKELAQEKKAFQSNLKAQKDVSKKRV